MPFDKVLEGVRVRLGAALHSQLDARGQEMLSLYALPLLYELGFSGAMPERFSAIWTRKQGDGLLKKRWCASMIRHTNK